MPAQLFQGSLMLGGIAKLGLTSGEHSCAAPVLWQTALGGVAPVVLPMPRLLPTLAHASPPPSPALISAPSAEALSHTQVFVSPLLVGGWCGLVTTALNCLPVGNLDGGRTMLVRMGPGGGREESEGRPAGREGWLVGAACAARDL